MAKKTTNKKAFMENYQTTLFQPTAVANAKSDDRELHTLLNDWSIEMASSMTTEELLDMRVYAERVREEYFKPLEKSINTTVKSIDSVLSERLPADTIFTIETEQMKLDLALQPIKDYAVVGKNENVLNYCKTNALRDDFLNVKQTIYFDKASFAANPVPELITNGLIREIDEFDLFSSVEVKDTSSNNI